MIHSYPSIYALGHKAVADIFTEEVIIEEKIDGSQFSFGVYHEPDKASAKPGDPINVPPDDVYPFRMRCRSKGAEIQMLAPEKMFTAAVETVQRLAPDLTPNWTYRGEYLSKPKHNSLSYDRVPSQNVILFDINTGLETYLPWEAKAKEAGRLGLETVPCLYHGKIESPDVLREMLHEVSVLGGTEIEGVVVKNYARFTIDKKAMMGKFVSERFKEIHAAEWKGANPNPGDILERLAVMYKSQARWAKAVQHLRESDMLEGSPKDIGLLFREVPKDILKECEAEIKDILFLWAWPRIQRATTAGMAEWYKELLLERQFGADPCGETLLTEITAPPDPEHGEEAR